MAKKKDEAAELAEKLVRVLEAQRDLGGEAYPLSLDQLAALTDLQALPLLGRATAKKPFKDRVLSANKKMPAAPLVLVEDLPRLVASPRLLEFALKTACKPEAPAVPVSSLTRVVDIKLRKPLQEVIARQVNDNTLPATVGCQVVKNKPFLYLRCMPPPPPPPPKKKPAVELAENLVAMLETQRQRGGDAYPLTLPLLQALTTATAEPKLFKQALGQEPFKSRVVLALKTDPKTPVALADDRERLLGSRVLLDFLLTLLRGETDQAFPVAKLKAKLAPELRQLFEETVHRELEADALAPGIGWLWLGKKRLLFRLADVHGVPGTPDEAAPTGDFAAAFDAAFDQLDRAAGRHNFISLVALRQAVPRSRPAFDDGLRQLRRAGRYTLSAAEGRHGVTPEEQQAGIYEDGMLLLYVSRRVS